MGSTRRFLFIEGGSNKFWEITVTGARMDVRFGRVGTAGTVKEKRFKTAEEAQREAAKLVAEKTKKGYVEEGARSATKGRAEKAATSKTAPKAPAKAAPKAPAKAAPKASNAAIQAMLTAISKKQKALAAQLRPGASDDGLLTLSRLQVPAAFSALYAAHDGSETELYGSYQLLSIAEIEAMRKTMGDLLATTPAWRETGRWNDHWVPFLSDGDGQLLCLDPVGSLEGGAAGNIITYDHETGPARELASFDVFVDLVTKLACKGLLGEEAREDEDRRPKIDELTDDARSVGLARMPAKALKKALAALDAEDLTEEAKLDLVLPLARQYPAERDLWQAVVYPAEELERWPLMVEAAASSERLTPARDRPYLAEKLVLALHRAGRDEEALVALTTALRTRTNYPKSQIPVESDPAFRHRCFAVATELRPKDWDLWLERGRGATDPAERTFALMKVLELTRDKELIKYNEGRAETARTSAERLLELDRIAKLSGAPKLAALETVTKSYKEGNDLESWLLVAGAATEQGNWKAAEVAGAKLLKLEASNYERHKLCRHQVLALHELGRDAKALAVLSEVVAAMYNDDRPDTLEALPFSDTPDLTKRDSADQTFAVACLDLVTKLQPQNPFLWHRLAKITTSNSVRRDALERVVALCTAPGGGDLVPETSQNRDFNRLEAVKHAAIRMIKCEARELLLINQ
jgi:predicted DNA-binding WGR domain protein/cell wall assembly regulator SMI1